MASRGHSNGNYREETNDVPAASRAQQASLSDNLNHNAGPNSSISTAMSIQEVCDVSSNAVINFIGQIMLEEDIDDEISICEATLKEKEKSFYNLLGKEYPLSPKSKNSNTSQINNTVNGNTSNAAVGATDNGVSSDHTSEPHLISATASHISVLSMEKLPGAKVQINNTPNINTSNALVSATDNGIQSYHTSEPLSIVSNADYISALSTEKLLATQVQIHSAFNRNTSNVVGSATNNGVLSYHTSEPLFIRANPDQISSLSMENLSATQFLKGVEEATKFIPNIENWFVGLEPKRNEFHHESEKNGGKKKATSSQIEDQNYTVNEGKQDQSEERVRKQRAVFSDEPERNDNLDHFLLSQGTEYVKEVTKLQEIIKKDMKNMSWENQADTTIKMTFEMTEIDEGSVDLRSLLLRCSEAVSMSNYSHAVELIKQIRKHASPTGDSSRRLAYYLVNALEARLFGAGSEIYSEIVSRQVTVTDYLKAYRVYHAVCPFMKATHYFSNQTILNVTKNATTIHIIDFGIHMGFLWPAFFERLAKLRNIPPKIRITGIELPQKGFRPNKLVDDTGRRLSDYAQRFNVRLKYRGIAAKWESIRIEDLGIEDDEVLIVNCIYRIENVADETVDMSCPRDKVLRMIREIKPRIFIHGIQNGSYSPFFTARFKEVVTRTSSVFDIFESNLPRSCESRFLMEKTIVSPKAINAVACEGSERVERQETYRQWHARNLRAGFVQFPLDSMIREKIKCYVRELYHKEFVVAEDNSWLLLGWKGVILLGLSTWVPNEHEIVEKKTDTIKA